MTLFDSLTVEVLFDGVTWVDLSSQVTGTVQIRQGRATEFDDITPAVLSLVLRNVDGSLMPDNILSPYYPNVVENRQIRIKLVRGATTWTRFWGWIADWRPSFPGASTVNSVVQVSAVDNLALLAKQRLISSWLGSGQINANTAGVRADLFVLDGDGFATQYFDNVTTNSGTKMRATTVDATNVKGPISYGNAEGLSVESAATFAPASDHTGTVIKMEANGHRCLQFWLKIPADQQVSAGTPSLEVASFWDATNTTTYGSLRLTNNAGTTDLAWYNAAGVFVSVVSQVVTEERWVRTSFLTRTATPTTTDLYHDGGVLSPLNIAMDFRNVRHIWFGGRGTLVPKMSVAGPVLTGNESTSINPEIGKLAGTGWTVANRMAGLNVSVVPVLTLDGTAGDAALTGSWHGRTALAVGQEIARTDAALFWARAFDSQVRLIGPGLTYPSTPLVTIDCDGDLASPPELARGVDSRPTRITVNYPGGKATVIDTAAEAAAGGQQSSKTVETICADFTQAETLAATLLVRSALGMRVRKLVIDLESAVNDLVPTLFSQASTTAGLFPSQRLRLLVPISHFGTATRDVFAEGWTEKYSSKGCTLEADCSASTGFGGSYPSSLTYPSSSTYPGA